VWRVEHTTSQSAPTAAMRAVRRGVAGKGSPAAAPMIVVVVAVAVAQVATAGIRVEHAAAAVAGVVAAAAAAAAVATALMLLFDFRLGESFLWANLLITQLRGGSKNETICL